MIFSGDSIIKEAVLLSLLNSAPPPVGPAPPPPPYGSIAGSITQDGNDFSFSLNFGAYQPDGVNYAFFTAAGGLIGVGSEDYSSTPMTWTTTLLESQTALATYAPVVAYKTGSGTANALTLT